MQRLSGLLTNEAQRTQSFESLFLMLRVSVVFRIGLKRVSETDAMQTPAALRVVADAAGLAAIRDFVEAQARGLALGERVVYDLVLAAHELATNVMQHGYAGQPGPLAVELRVVGDAVEIQIDDAAPAFDPTSVPPPDITVPPERRAPGGLGIYMARRMADELRYRRAPAGNQVTIVKRGIGDRR